jgi:hypothetical protein
VPLHLAVVSRVTPQSDKEELRILCTHVAHLSVS